MAEMTDWRLPENRREAFQRHYSINLRYKAHPGLVYSQLPAIADAYDLDDNGRAWLVWLNGNTQNPVTSLLLLEAAPRPSLWRLAVEFWNENFKLLEWDTDRRHQKSKFGEATEKFWTKRITQPAERWCTAANWPTTWRFAVDQPYMGRLSAWSMIEYARILFGAIVPDATTLLLEDRSGSRSHRNGLAVVSGFDAAYWDDEPFVLDIVPELEALGESLYHEALDRNPGNPDVTYLTFESCLCTSKSCWKENRRYPGVYADMNYLRILRGEKHFGPRFEILWDARHRDLPAWMRLESNPYDPGLCPAKQNQFRETGRYPVIGHEYPDMWSDFDTKVELGLFGVRHG